MTHTRFHRLPGWGRVVCGLGLLAGLSFVGCQRPEATHGVRIATTTSYLEAAARDLLGEHLLLVRLAEPGSCPGHFDIRPGQAAELRRCQALLRFDFQKALDAIVAGNGSNRVPVVEVRMNGGMCQPESYLTACRQVADGLVAHGWLAQTNADARLQAVGTRLQALARDVTNRVAQAGWMGAPVITSPHQKAFCEWLGLKVVATFRSADTASVAEIEAAIRGGELAGARLVIANRPEGRRTADALAERLNAQVVTFGNFPAPKDGRPAFDDLVTDNVDKLVEVSNR